MITANPLDTWWNAVQRGADPALAAQTAGVSQKELAVEWQRRQSAAEKPLTPMDVLAEGFLSSIFGADLWCTTGYENDHGKEITCPNGVWYQIKERRPNNVTILGDIIPAEVQGLILQYMQSVSEPITYSRVVEIERLARLLSLLEWRVVR